LASGISSSIVFWNPRQKAPVVWMPGFADHLGALIFPSVVRNFSIWKLKQSNRKSCSESCRPLSIYLFQLFATKCSSLAWAKTWRWRPQFSQLAH
jgi:hypothetical protein